MEKLISWVEIPATDFERAVKFYSAVLEIKLEIADFGSEKMACFPTGEGAISWAKDFNPSSNGVLVSLNTGNRLNATLKTIEKNGGEIVTPKTKINAENRGYFAVFIDSEGNKLGLYGDS